MEDVGIYPNFDRVLIRTIPIEEKTAGGIVIAATTQEKENQAQVHGILMAMGPVAEVAQEMKGIKVGDMVIHAKFAGLTYRGADGVLYRIMRMSDIVGRTNEMHDKSFRGSIPMQSSVPTE